MLILCPMSIHVNAIKNIDYSLHILLMTLLKRAYGDVCGVKG